MPGTWSRCLLVVAALGLVGACEEIPPPEEPAVVAPPVKKKVVAAPVVKKPVAAAPVVKKPATVDIDFGGEGGGGTGGGGWQG
jgi:hypothetical protein